MSTPQDARRRGPYRKGMQQRQRILAEAAVAFARSGFSGASLRVIASAVGVSHSLIVQMFGTKEGLLLAVLERWDEDLQTRLAGQDGAAFLRCLGDVMRVHEGERGIVELFIVMSAEATDPRHPAHSFIVERSRRVREEVTRHLLIAADRGEIAPLDLPAARAAAREVTAMMNGMELQWLLHSDLVLSSAFDAFLARWLRDLGASEE